MHNYYVVACALDYEDSLPKPYHSSTPAKVHNRYFEPQLPLT